MNRLVFALELRRSRSLLFWLAVTSIVYAGMMALYYPRLSSNVAAIDEMLKMFPKEMLAAFSIEGNLTDQGTYFNVYVFSMVWPIVAAIGAILLATRTVGADLEKGFLELSLATPVTRSRYLLAGIANQVVALAALAALTVVSIVALGPLIGVSFDVGRFAVVGLLSFGFGAAIAAATTLIAVVTLSRGIAGGVVAGGLVLMYLAQTVSKLAPDASSISYLSLFRYLAPAPVINEGTIPGGDLAVFGAVAIGCWALAVVLFRRRELVA